MQACLTVGVSRLHIKALGKDWVFGFRKALCHEVSDFVGERNGDRMAALTFGGIPVQLGDGEKSCERRQLLAGCLVTVSGSIAAILCGV